MRPPKNKEVSFSTYRWIIYGMLLWLVLMLVHFFAWRPHVLDTTFAQRKEIETRRLETLLTISAASTQQKFLRLSLAASPGWKSWKISPVEGGSGKMAVSGDIIVGDYTRAGKTFRVQVELDRNYFLTTAASQLNRDVVALSVTLFVILFFFIFYVRTRHEAPMQALISATEKIATGDYNARLDGDIFKGISRKLAFSFRTMGDNLQHAHALMQEEVQATKLSEEKYRQSEERFRAVFDNVADIIIIVNQKGVIQKANPAVSKILGYAPEELVGRHINVLVPPYLHENHDFYLDRYVKTGVKTMIDGGVFELPVINRQGEEVVCGLSVSRMELADGLYFIGLIRDISERMQMEQKIRQERDRAQKYLDTVEVIILAHDIDGRITLLNRKGKEVLQPEGVSCLGKDWYDCSVDNSVREELREMMREVVTGESPMLEYMEYPIRTGTGEIRQIAWHYSKLLDNQGNISGFLCSGEDVTQQRRNEQERYRLKTQLMQAQKMESVGQLTGGIAHDFNNILASVLGYTELAQEWVTQYQDGKLNDYLATIYSAGTRARDLVDKMLAYSRGKSGAGKAELSLVPVIQDVLKMLRSVLPSSIAIRTELDAHVPNIQMDTIELQQVIMNLCINARDAMEGQGEIVIRVRWHREMSGNCSSCFEPFSGEYIELAIADNGPGIPGEEQRKIFEPFFSTKAMGKGSGMGLSVVHGIVHGRGGHITMESRPGHGTEFHLYFRPSSHAEISDTSATAQTRSISRIRTAAAKVMVVEDDAETGGMIRALLEKQGYRVSMESEPARALSKYRQDPASCDLVILDFSRSNMSSVELAALMLMEKPELPILICNEESQNMNREQLLAAGIRDVISRPRLQEDLLLSVQEALAA